MNTAEVVIGEMQSNGSFQMGHFFAVAQGQAGKPLNCLPHGQVLPFDKTRRDVLGIGIAHSHFGYNPRDARWGVPRFGRVKLPVTAKHLRQFERSLCQGQMPQERTGGSEPIHQW